MSLFDSNITEYSIRWERIADHMSPEKGTKGSILNQDNTEIGKFLSEDNLEHGYEMSIFDMNENLVLKVTSKSKWTSREVRITDSENQVVGTSKTKGIRNPLVIFVNSDDEQIFVEKTDIENNSGKIIDLQDNVVGEYLLTEEKQKRGFLKSPLRKITYNLKIHDSNIDRKALLSFFIAILDIVIPHIPSYGV